MSGRYYIVKDTAPNAGFATSVHDQHPGVMPDRFEVVEAVRRDPATLAALPEVQAMLAAERERAAGICCSLGVLGGVTPNPYADWKTHADNLAAAIRKGAKP
jgi:hypothetical protein